MIGYASRLYFRSRAKFTTNLASINSRDLRELPVALPPLPEQRALFERVAAARAEIARERAEADRLAAAIAAETEALLLGRPI
jgi:type I restriction enzyme S subunit